MNLDKSLADIEKFLAQHKTLKDYIDETGELFVFASTLLSLIIAPNPVSAIAAFGLGTDLLAFKFSKLFDWLPEKLNYWKRGKNEIVVSRYEKAMLVNMMIFHIAIRAGIKKVMPPHIKSYKEKVKELSRTIAFDVGKNEVQIKKEGERIDEKVRLISLEFNENRRNSTSVYIRTVCMPLISAIVDMDYLKEKNGERGGLKKDDKENILTKLTTEIYINYQAFLVHLSLEFPEFSTWVDLNQKEHILRNQNELLKQLERSKLENSDFKKLQKGVVENIVEIQKEFIQKLKTNLQSIQELKDFSFERSFGFDKLHQEQLFVSRKLDDLVQLQKEEKLVNIEAYHNGIKRKLEERIVNNEDIEGIVYPPNSEIFVPQSFRSISYQQNKHQNRFLLDDFWQAKELLRGENIGKYIMGELHSPLNSFKPILILGNPGAGKSMLSSILSARLCDSSDFVPFLIRLRDVVMNDTNPRSHINEGIKNELEGNVDVDWVSWAKEFNTRIPVIILDGFDELLRASQVEINNYLIKIQNLLVSVYKDYKISARIILTSRLTVMQDVEIPKETTIIRLEPFDKKRQNQWVEQWNKFQKKDGFVDFKVPNDLSVKELAKEPLLLFMLGVYDFGNADLQRDVKHQSFNQSKLYDKLFNKFTYRQLAKDSRFGELSEGNKNKLAKRFRLRLGAISTLMFLNDVDYKETKTLAKELEALGLGGSGAIANLVFKGFFFVHNDKSTELSGLSRYTFEFVHRSFGEFLTADFLIRIFLERFEYDDKIEELVGNDIIRFCWGYNWLHRHPDTTKFLFEHSKQLISEKKVPKNEIVGIIKEELTQIFGTKMNLFPIISFDIMPSKPVLEHLGIYSQNLILFWVAIEKMKGRFPFLLFGSDEIDLNKFYFESQIELKLIKIRAYGKKSQNYGS